MQATCQRLVVRARQWPAGQCPVRSRHLDMCAIEQNSYGLAAVHLGDRKDNLGYGERLFGTAHGSEGSTEIHHIIAGLT